MGPLRVQQNLLRQALAREVHHSFETMFLWLDMDGYRFMCATKPKMGYGSRSSDWLVDFSVFTLFSQEEQGRMDGTGRIHTQHIPPCKNQPWGWSHGRAETISFGNRHFRFRVALSLGWNSLRLRNIVAISSFVSPLSPWLFWQHWFFRI